MVKNVAFSSRENHNGGNLNLTFSPVFSFSRALAIFPLGFERCVKFRYLSSLYGIAVLAVIFIFKFSYVRQILRHEPSGTNVVLYCGYAGLNVTLCAACVIAPLINVETLNAIVEG